MSGAVSIRRAEDSDLSAIAAIQTASPEAAQWRAGEYLKYQTWVASRALAVAGFITWRTTAPGENEILNLAVAPEHRGQGIARQLVRTALESAPGRWFLEVRESNLPARKLYASMGFTDAGVRSAYYEEPRESGIVMTFCS